MTTLHMSQEPRFRPNANDGVWCIFLLPLALWTSFKDPSDNNFHHDNANLKRATLLLSTAMALFSLIIAYRVVIKDNNDNEKKKGDVGVFSHLKSLLISDLFERFSSRQVRLRRKSQMNELNDGFIRRRQSLAKTMVKDDVTNAALTLILVAGLWSLGTVMQVVALAAICLFLYTKLLPRLFDTFPGSFTFGEGSVCIQAALISIFECFSSLLLSTDDLSSIEGSFSTIAKAGFVSCAILCVSPLVPGFRIFDNTTFFITFGIVILVGLTIPFLWFRLHRDPISWLVQTILSNTAMFSLTLLWMTVVIVALSIVQRQEERATTRLRKVFHVLAIMIFAPGILVDARFTYLASIVALCCFILCEGIRLYRVKPLSTWLSSSLNVFLDEKDLYGSLILTHIYLLVGCAAPLWLVHDLSASVSKVRLLSGVLAVGIGDSAASFVGSKFGNVRLPESSKSVEGTAASVVAQLLFLWMLEKLGLIVISSWSSLYLPIFIVSLAEALTNQVDNLTLPLMLYILL